MGNAEWGMRNGECGVLALHPHPTNWPDASRKFFKFCKSDWSDKFQKSDASD